MDTSPRYRRWLYGAAIGALLALTIAPPSSWYVRFQLRQAVPIAQIGLAGLDNKDFEQRARVAMDYARRHPGDYQIQLASVMFSNSSCDARWQALRALEPAFPNSPSLYANALRIACQKISVHRPEEEDQLSAHPPDRSKDVQKPYQPPVADLAVYDAEAARGEELDPANAYFPLLRATGLFALHRDDEAIAALKRAAAKHEWREYYEDEVFGEFRLLDGAFGDRSALGRTAAAAALLFPHFAGMRATARVATVKAMEAELAGRPDEGLAIRHAVMRCGSIMRADSHSAIGMLVGIAITAVASARPGGAPVPPHPPVTEGQKALKETMGHRYDAYCAYLERIGHPEEAKWVRTESEAGITCREAFMNAHVDPMPLLARVAIEWVVGLLLLCSAVWMLVAGGASALLGRTRWFRYNRPLPVAVTLGAFTAPLAIVIGVAAYWDRGGLLQGSCVVAAMGILPLAIAGAIWNRWRFRQALLAFCTSAAALGIIGLIAAAQLRMPAMLLYAASLVAGPGGLPSWPDPYGLVELGALCLPVALPLLAAATFAIASAVCGVPASIGVVRGFRGLAAPTVCVLVLLFAAQTVDAVRQEQALNAYNDHWVRNETGYAAQISGIAWPSPTP